MDKGKIIIGCDHAGYALKEGVAAHLHAAGWLVTDLGAWSKEPVDYPDIGAALAQRVASGEFPRGILICGSGVGMTIVANRFPGVRAVLALDEETARMSRLHNDANILVLAGRRTDLGEAENIIRIWLDEAFLGGRHQLRLDKITALEAKLYR